MAGGAGAEGSRGGAGAIQASSQSGIVVADARPPFTNERMVIGARGATSTAHFVCWGDAGTAIDSGIALDSAFHTHVVTRNGATTKYYIDGVLVGTGNARPSVDSYVHMGVSETASRVVQCDAFKLAVGILVP